LKEKERYLEGKQCVLKGKRVLIGKRVSKGKKRVF
jgi:hypothetical protein